MEVLGSDVTKAYGTVHYGARGNTVKKIQKRLADLGYPVGSVDGKYGTDTQVAIDLFCEAIAVKSHDYITKKVQNKLFADDAPICVNFDIYLPLKKGDKGANVRYMQKRLKELGYDPGKVDGDYGKNTVAAVSKFQSAYDIAREVNEKPGEVASRDMLITLYSKDTKPQIGTAASIDGGASNFK